MSYPGEYPESLQRVTNLQGPVVSGYATFRLKRQDPIFFGGSGDDDFAQIYLHNSGSTNFTVQLQQSDTPAPAGSNSAGTPTGTRFNVGSATALVPGGHKTLQVSPYKAILEVRCTSGNGVLRGQISSRTRWDRLAFDKTDTAYPPQLFQAKPVPVAPNV